MADVREMTDRYMNDPSRKIYTFKEMGVPGLSVLGRLHLHSAGNPSDYHYHQDRIEIKLFISGNTVIFTEEKEYHLKGGDIFITPANMPHGTGSLPTGVCEAYWTQLLTGTPSFLFLETEWAAELQRQLKSLPIGVIRGVNYSRKYLADMFSFITSDISFDKYRGVSRLVSILHEIIAARSQLQDSPSADIQKAIDFIRTNINDEIVLEDLAEEAGLSLISLIRKFQEQIGMPPRMFINVKKIETAKELLAKGKSVTDTAFALGFNSSSYFTSVFRKFTRMTPGEFAKKKQQQIN